MGEEAGRLADGSKLGPLLCPRQPWWRGFGAARPRRCLRRQRWFLRRRQDGASECLPFLAYADECEVLALQSLRKRERLLGSPKSNPRQRGSGSTFKLDQR